METLHTHTPFSIKLRLIALSLSLVGLGTLLTQSGNIDRLISERGELQAQQAQATAARKAQERQRATAPSATTPALTLSPARAAAYPLEMIKLAHDGKSCVTTLSEALPCPEVKTMTANGLSGGKIVTTQGQFSLPSGQYRAAFDIAARSESVTAVNDDTLKFAPVKVCLSMRGNEAYLIENRDGTCQLPSID